ncbi:DcaP family trimeric outer membrane transporter [Palleronia sediminis]|nr:DcaP family trimeric outer membrane transporter [Palleronia sediminis]
MPRCPIPARLACASALALCAAMPALAQTSDAERIAALEARVADLEAGAATERPALSFGSARTEVEFYGYIKVDAIYDFGAELGNTTFGLVGLTGDDGDAFFNATAQQTRLGFKTTTPTGLGAFGSQLEIDFYGGEGAVGTEDPYEPRVRIAKVSLGGLQLGKDWTTFMPLASYPSSLDFQGVAGIPFARQEQIRFTHGFGGDYVAEIALEESNGDSDDPVFVAALAYDTDPLLLRVSGLAGTVDDGFGGSEDIYGVNLSTTARLWEGGTLDASYTFGEGIASYMVFVGDDVDAAGERTEQRAAYIGLTQAVGEKLTLRAMYGHRENEGNDPAVFSGFDKLTSVHLNAEYEVVEDVLVGVEYFHGTLDTFAGRSFDVDRVQASFTYNF